MQFEIDFIHIPNYLEGNMKKAELVCLLALSGGSWGEFNLSESLRSPQSSELTEQDKESLETIMRSRERAFDERDSNKLGELLAENSNFVNQSGRLYWGKEANVARHEKVFSPDAGQHLLAHEKMETALVKWSAYGNPAHTVILVTEYQFPHHNAEQDIQHYDPMKPTKGLFTTVLAKENSVDASPSEWKIISMQNTPYLPAQLNE
ncbi:Cif family virulence factor [Sansalvadorimonas verongulae]|uniref:nuclear transport factor 2 family protein n=1 Tax=Sansalvadorimonas verongulae TaxID=2172824 RepID=UPI0018AD12EB|nr:nuclear transport factor 2 family protein [Sansalvadorimonas verongulae]